MKSIEKVREVCGHYYHDESKQKCKHKCIRMFEHGCLHKLNNGVCVNEFSECPLYPLVQR